MRRPRIHFTVEFDEQTSCEIAQKGRFGGCRLELPGAIHMPITFYDPVRFSQERASEFARGAICFADIGAVVIPEVTKENMERAVEHLWDSGYWAGISDGFFRLARL